MSSPDYVGYGTLIAGMAAVGTVIWAIYQYTRGLVIQRQKVLFDHIKDLNESKEFIPAKKLLGYGYVRKTKDDYYTLDGDVDYYTFKDLDFLNDPSQPIQDPGKLEIKDSLDSFVVFLGKVGYSLKVGAIERHEILYFKYWINRTTAPENKAVKDYIDRSEFPLYQILLKEVNNYGIFGKRGSKWGKYEAEYGLTLGQRKILNIIKEKSGPSPSTFVSGTAVIEASGLSADKVDSYLSQLQDLGFVKIGKVSGVDFRRVNITKQGLNEGTHKKSIRSLLSLWLRRPSQ